MRRREPGKTAEISEITRDNYASDDLALGNFDEAKEWGSSLVLHTWPRDCEDADVEY
jgi:hypothetical protein